MKARLTEGQMKALKPYERNFHQAVDAHYCSSLTDRDTNLMRAVWEEMTGAPRIGWRNGCGSCVLHLVQDLGTIYLAQQAEEASAVTAEATKPAEASNPTPAQKAAPKAKKNAK